MKKHNQTGYSQLLVMLLVIVLVAVVGTYFLVASHAEPNSGPSPMRPYRQ